MSTDSDCSGDESMDVEEIPHNLSASRPIRQKRMKIKRNKKGESQLHLACIRGDIRIVNMLLRQGHDLTVRDNAGWTPLHEACNHGHIEVVRLLLSHNFVDVNAKGMAELTPLHDALQAGSFDVAVELLKHPKIDVTRKTSEGLDALDFIDGWLESFAEPNENEDENADRELLVRLRADISERMKQQNYRHVSNRALAAKSFSVEQQKRRAKRGGSNDTSAANDKEGDDASTDDGAEAYKRTIAGIGRSALSRSILKRSRRVADEPLSPFVHDEDLPASDKWLIDDSAPISRDAVSAKAKSRQRKQPSVARKTARSTVSFDFEQPQRRSYSPTAALSSDDLFTSEAAASQRLRQDSESRHSTNNLVASISATDSDRVHRILSDDIIDVVDDIAEHSVHFVPSNSNIHKASRDFPRSHVHSPFSDRGNYQNVSSRRRIQNLDEDTSTTVASIASKTTIFQYQYDGSSYMTSFVASEKIKDIEAKIIQRLGLKICDKAPMLKLFKDGAELDSEDFAESFIANGNELTAKIIGSYVVSLSDLYKSNCAKEKTRVYANVVAVLEFSRSFELSFEDFLLDSTSVTPVLQSLRSSSSIVALNLSGNQLAHCLTLLGEVCVHLASTLTQLNLSQSLLAASDLRDLVVALQDREGHLRWISLDLSCNHLGNACCEILSQLFQFTPLLNKLNLSFTGIIGSRCENSPSQCLLQLQGLKHLSHFDCSGSSLNRNDLSLLFSNLAFSDTCLRHLNLSACWQTPVGVLNSIVDEFTTTDLSKLQSLNLGNCDLSPPDIFAFTSRVLPTMLGLEVLTLSENARLDTASFGVVLEASVTHSLHSLVFCNCALIVPFGDRVLNALQSKLLLVDAKLQYLKFTLSHAQNYANDADIRCLEELWSSAWPFCASPHPYRSRFGFDFEFSCN